MLMTHKEYYFLCNEYLLDITKSSLVVVMYIVEFSLCRIVDHKFLTNICMDTSHEKSIREKCRIVPCYEW